MSQFEGSTEKKAAAAHAMIADTKDLLALKWEYIEAWKCGRNSARESLEILARALESIAKASAQIWEARVAEEAIAAVKQRGDWPIEAPTLSEKDKWAYGSGPGTLAGNEDI